MTAKSSANHKAKSRAAVQVAAWKLEIQSFFHDDWSRLRTLIMDLEEQSWDDSSPTDPQCVQGNHTSPEQKPVVRDRLSELAEQIERRLQTSHPDGR